MQNVPTTPSADLAATVAALAADVAELREQLRTLERRRGLLDAEDAALLAKLADSTQGLRFNARHVFEHARRVERPLLDALAAATIGSAGELGCWLRRMVGRHGDVRVTRDGRHWRVLHIAHECADR